MTRRAAWLVGLALAAGCGGAGQPDPRYRPTESVLEVVAVLHRHVADDTYRFPPAQDFTGRNVYRASPTSGCGSRRAGAPARSSRR